MLFVALAGISNVREEHEAEYEAESGEESACKWSYR